MARVEVTQEEIKALNDLMEDAKCPIEMGKILFEFREKVVKAFKKEMMQKQEQAAKNIMKQNPKLLAQVAKEVDSD